jgi:hypothetical protein
VIFAIGNKGGKISKVQTVKTEAAVVPKSPKLSVVPMMGDFFIGDAWRSRFERMRTNDNPFLPCVFYSNVGEWYDEQKIIQTVGTSESLRGGH